MDKPEPCSPEPSHRDTALEWFVRLRDPELADAARAEFAAWRDADPRHAAAYRQVEALWSALDELPPAQRPGEPGPQPAGVVALRPRGRSLARPLRRLAQAAAVVLVLVGAGYLLANPTAPDALLADLSTGVGERLQQRLEDGSQVDLDAATALSVDYTDGQRLITLHGGEAYFEVAGDPERPFVVQTALGRVHALGTAFAVKADGGIVDVVVTESRVAVTHTAGQRIELSAGQSLRLLAAGPDTVVTRDPGRVLAWREGRLEFRDTPLAEVVATLERHRHGRIVLTDAGLGDLRVTGAFAADRGDRTLAAIEAAFPVQITYLTDYIVLISPRAP